MRETSLSQTNKGVDERAVLSLQPGRNIKTLKVLQFTITILGWVTDKWLIRYHTFGILILQIEASFTNALALYRFDTIFDYGNNLQETRAVKLLNQYFGHLMNVVQPEMQLKNQQRKDNGDLTYPYLIPRWLPNGIQT